MAAAEGADKTKLDNWYDATQGLQEVTERDLTKFADLAATYWAVPSLRQCGKQIHSQGYQNNRLVAVLTDKDLESIGILPGHAKLLAQHLGGITPAPPPAPAPSNIQVRASCSLVDIRFSLISRERRKSILTPLFCVVMYAMSHV